MTLPDYPSPWWDTTKYDFNPTLDWSHVLICKQCGNTLPVSREYLDIHNGYHAAQLDLIQALRNWTEAASKGLTMTAEELDRTVADPPYPEHAQASRDSWRQVIQNPAQPI